MSLDKSNWTIKKLSDCCLSIADGDHLPPPKSDTGIPFVTISNIVGNKFDFTDTMFVPQAYFDNLDSKRKAQVGDVLYSVVGSFGIPVYIDADTPFVFQRHIAILRPNKEVILPRFLYYTMLSHDFYMMADAAAVGAAQRTVSLTSLRNMQISVPPIEVQEQIVGLLAPYDDLIATNQKQIGLLEEAAQRIYKEWFIDLRFPGYESVTFTDGIPDGWEKGLLKDIAVNSGVNVKVGERDKFDCYLPIDCMPKKSIGYIDTMDVSFAESSLQSFKENDIVMGAMRPYFHKVVVARHKGLTRNTCFVINSKHEDYRVFLSMLIFDEKTIKYATQNSVGTTMPYIRWKDFIKMPIVIPDNETALRFSNLVSPIIDEIQSRASFIKETQQARDLLLPKLVSMN